MNKKLVSLFTMVAFMIFSMSCTIHSIKNKSIETVADKGGMYIKVKGILKTSGEFVRFPEVRDGKIHQDVFLILPTKSIPIEINRVDAESIIREEGNITRIVTKSGKMDYGVIIREDEDKIVFNRYESIPLSEVNQILVREPNPVMSILTTFLLIGGILVAGAVIGAVYIISQE